MVTESSLTEEQAAAERENRLAVFLRRRGRAGAAEKYDRSQRIAEIRSQQEQFARRAGESPFTRDVPASVLALEQAPREYVRRKRGKEKEYDSYDPVIVRETSTGYEVIYQGTVERERKNGYNQKVVEKKHEYRDAQGRLLREIITDYDDGREDRRIERNYETGEVQKYDYGARREEAARQEQELFKAGMSSKEIEGLTPGERKEAYAQLAKPTQGSTARSSSTTPVYEVEVNGKKMLVSESVAKKIQAGGFGPSAPQSTERPAVRGAPPSPFLQQLSGRYINPYTSEEVQERSYAGELRPAGPQTSRSEQFASFLVEDIKNAPRTTSRADVARFTSRFLTLTPSTGPVVAGVVTGITTLKAPQAGAYAESIEVAPEIRARFDEAGFYGDPAATRAVVSAAALRSAGKIISNPTERSVFAVGSLLALPGALPAAAVGTGSAAVTATAGPTLLQSAIGGGLVVSAALSRGPGDFVGETAPYVLGGIAAYGAGRAANTGVIIRALQPGETTLPSTELRVAPIEGYEFTGAKATDKGVVVRTGTFRRVTGEEQFMTSEELAAQPKDFLYYVEGETSGFGTQPAGPRTSIPQTQSGATASREIRRFGLTTAEEIKSLPESYSRVDVGPSPEPFGYRGQQAGKGIIRFESYEAATTSELATIPKPPGPRTKTPERLNYQPPELFYQPLLDYQEGLLAVEQPGVGRVEIFREASTGRLITRTQGKPLEIRGVVEKGPGAPTGAGGSVTTGDGQILLLEPEAPAQASVSVVEVKPAKAELKTREETAMTQRQETVQEVKQEPLKVQVRKVNPSERLGEAARTGGLFPVVTPAQQSRTSTRTARPAQRTSPAQAQSSAQAQAQPVAELQLSLTGQSTGQSVSQSQTRTDTVTDTFPRVDTLSRPQEFEPETPRIPPAGRLGQKKTAPLFDVEVRRKGEFRTSFQGLRLEEAVRFGEGLVDTTAARSFKITAAGTGAPIIGEDKAAAERLLTPGRFRAAKNDKNIFVEKSKFAINTPGEKRDIRPKRGVFAAMDEEERPRQKKTRRSTFGSIKW